MAPLPKESIEYLINHVVLPPRLPQKAESPTVSRKGEQDLLRLVLGQVRAYSIKSSPDLGELWRIAEEMLIQWITLNVTEKLSSEALNKVFGSMRPTGKLGRDNCRYPTDKCVS